MITLSLILLGAVIVGGLVAVLRGPTPLDRLLALDFLSLPMAAILVVWGTIHPESHARDIALILVVAGFVGVVIAAPRLARRKGQP